MAVCVVLVIVAAAALRLVDLGSQPGGLYQDEAAEGWDAYRVLHEPGFHPLFFDDDGGREPLFAYLCALIFRLVGASVTSLRATAAVLGVLAVLALVFALRRFGVVAMLCGAGWAAGSAWLVSVSRDGMRNVLMLLVGALATWALLHWMARPTCGTALLAGGTCALGLWTYQPLKLLPLLVVLWLLTVRRTNAAAARLALATWRAAVLAYMVVAAPMLYVAVTDARGYFGRGLTVIAGSTAPGDGVLVHVLRTLAGFGVAGDPNPRHDVDSLALIPPLVAALVLGGAVVAWRRRAHPEYVLLLTGLPVFALPGLVAVEGGAPHGLRLLGLVPSVAGLSGVGAEAAVRWAARRGRATALAATAALAVALGGMALHTGHAYLTRDTATRYDAYRFDLVALADAARPGDVVISDDYSALVVDFVDAGAPPTVIQPGAAVPHGGAVLALRREDLAAALGTGRAARARAVAWRPDGTPAVWRVAP